MNNLDDAVLYVMPPTMNEPILLPMLPQTPIKNRKCSNRKDKTISKNKRNMVKASKRKNRKR